MTDWDVYASCRKKANNEGRLEFCSGEEDYARGDR